MRSQSGFAWAHTVHHREKTAKGAFYAASFLLGQVDSGTVNPPANVRTGKRFLAFFVQDSWKVTRKLTLDYGLRYDYDTYP